MGMACAHAAEAPVQVEKDGSAGEVPAPRPARGNPESYYHYLLANLHYAEGQSPRKNVEGYRAELAAAADADPHSAQIRYELGNACHALGQFDQAAKHYQEALWIDPGHASALVQLARIQIRQGQKDQASQNLERANTLDPGNPAVMLKLGQMHHDAGRFEEAEKFYQSFIEAFPEDPGGHASMGALRMDQERPLEALPWFRAAAELNPYDVTLMARQADAMVKAGEMNAAAGVYRRMLLINPEDAYALGRLVSVLEQLGQQEEAVGMVEAYVRTHPTQYEWSFRLAQYYLAAQHPVQAARLLEQLVRAQPRSGKYRLMLGVAYQAANDHAAALAAYDSVGADQGEYYLKANVQWALLARQEGKSAEAVTRMERLVSEGVADEGTYRLLSVLYQDTRRGALAIAALENGVRKFPQSADLVFAYAVSLDEEKRGEEAMTQMWRVIALDPQHANALNYLGYTYAEKGIRLEEAESLIRRALASKPGADYILDSLGWVLYQQGRYQEALEPLLQAASGEKPDPVILEHLGHAQARLGRCAEAAKSFQSAARLLEGAERDRLNALATACPSATDAKPAAR